MRNQLFELLKNKDHVIWDWNGTLLNDVDHAVESMNHLLESHALPRLTRDRYQQVFDFPIRNYYDALGFDYEKESFENLCHRFVDRFMSRVHDQQLFDDTIAVVRELKKLGIEQSVLSASYQPDLEAMMTHFNLHSLFSRVLGIQDKFAASKIEQGRVLLRESKVPLHRTVMVGDTLHDLEVSETLGIEAVLVAHGHQSRDRLLLWHSNVL